MSQPFLGEIRIFPYNFAPRGWAFCNGQLLSISQNTALFSLLGTTYGGNGQTTFALPDLRGRVPVSSGQGPGLSNFTLGEETGTETVTLTTAEIPPHTHPVAASARSRTTSDPSGKNPSLGGFYDSDATNHLGTPTPAGGGQPHENHQPLLVLNFCIALQGIYPSRN